jgi:hypothetical protein
MDGKAEIQKIQQVAVDMGRHGCETAIGRINPAWGKNPMAACR